MIEALICFAAGGILGGAIGFCRADMIAADDLDLERKAHDATRADRDRWKRLANKLHDENDAQRAFLEPIFKSREN
jgi:hypothetical protein